MSWWWPFGSRKLSAPLSDSQKRQIDESVDRIKAESHQRVETAKTKLEAAAGEAVQAVDRRKEEAKFLRQALKTLIDRQSHGRFDLQRSPGRPQ